MVASASAAAAEEENFSIWGNWELGFREGSGVLLGLVLRGLEKRGKFLSIRVGDFSCSCAS